VLERGDRVGDIKIITYVNNYEMKLMLSLLISTYFNIYII
jgi:hypothetical protein